MDNAMDASKKLSVEELAELSNSEDWLVRFHAAMNPDTPVDSLVYLAGDDSMWVRNGVAQHARVLVMGDCQSRWHFCGYQCCEEFELSTRFARNHVLLGER